MLKFGADELAEPVGVFGTESIAKAVNNLAIFQINTTETYN
jgi:hypothetical protein